MTIVYSYIKQFENLRLAFGLRGRVRNALYNIIIKYSSTILYVKTKLKFLLSPNICERRTCVGLLSPAYEVGRILLLLFVNIIIAMASTADFFRTRSVGGFASRGRFASIEGWIVR